jgi:diguanylate cyclase (GGDEF)-like protein
VSIPVIILGIIVYLYLEERLGNESERKIKVLAEIQANYLTDTIENEKLHTKVISRQAAIQDLLLLKDGYSSNSGTSNDLLEGAKDYFASIVMDFNLVQDIFLIDSFGEIVVDSSKGYELTGQKVEWDYWKNSIRVYGSKNSVFGNEMFLDNKIVITEPVFDEAHVFLGAIGKILNLNSITEKVLKTKFDNTGYFYFVDSNGIIMGHPVAEKIGTVLENDKIRQVVKGLGNSDFLQAGVGTYLYRGEEKFMGYKIIPELNWVVVATQNMTEVKEPALFTFLIIAIATILLVIISSFISLRISEAITNPIEKLMNNMKMAEEGDLTVQCNVNSKDELGMLSNSFNVMIGKLNLSYDELSALYEQLSAAEEELRAQYEELQTSEEVQRKNAEKLEFMAYYDVLTQLPNKISFMNELDNKILSNKEGSCSGVVMLIDLDNFKNINDTLGHDYGDMLIKEIANRLNSIKSEDDIIYRIGGDEYVVLRTSEDSYRDVKEFANELQMVIKEKYTLAGKSIYISGSIGIAGYPKDGNSAKLILKSADTAMNNAKEKGKNRYELFDNTMYDVLERKLKIEDTLRRALIEKDFYLLYQPQYDIANNSIVGFEALLRINPQKYGYISPADFIPIAEETGLIVPIGEWVLREACSRNQVWRSLGYKYDTLSVNISSVQLQHPDFLDTVKEILNETGISPENLELEITESILMESIDYSVNMLKQLRGMGIKVALDDFGTGYSSLNYLKKLPITTLKMDKSFIDEISLSKKEEAVAKSIIDMAHTMDLCVVAEGVEQLPQLEILSTQQCDRVQGYLFSKPLPENMVGEVFAKESREFKTQI